MAKQTKRFKNIQQRVKAGALYTADAALTLLKEVSSVKFDESVDVSINLGIDPKKSEQAVRGAVVLPHGTGRKIRVAVFAEGGQAEAAKAAGADVVGYDDLANDIKQGKIDFDLLIATPDSMRLVGQLGQILGPKGLMPNPKVGTVTADVTTAVKNAKTGQVRFRADKNGIVHCSVGKVSFNVSALSENLDVLLQALKRSKPNTSKGNYLKKITLSTTMGPGLMLEQL